MARDRDDRYSDAQQLAEDLRRYQEGQLVGARAFSRTQLLSRWLSSNRYALGLVAILAIAGTIATLGIRSQRDEAVAAKEEAVAAKEVISVEREAAVSRSNQLILAQAAAKLESDPMASLAWLKHYPESESQWDLVAEIGAVAVSKGVIRRILRGHTDAAVTASFDMRASGCSRDRFTGLSMSGTMKPGEPERLQRAFPMRAQH